jgi:putative ABC transport system ATP-binding protein
MESGIFRFILRYSKKEQLILLAVIGISFPFLYMSMDLPKIIINQAIGGTDFPKTLMGAELEQIPYLLALCVIFLTLVLINGMFKLWVNIYRGALGERMLRRVRYQLIERLMRFPLSHFRNISQGEVVSIVTTETEPLGGFFGEAFSLPVFQGGTLLTILAFMFIQDWALGLAAIALYPVQMYAIPKLQMKINLLAKKRVARVRKLSERVGELVSGMHEVHANDTSQYELADFSNRLGKIFAIRYDIYRQKFFVKFLNNFIAQLTPFLFFSIGGYLVIQGDLSFGALVATLGAYKDLSSPWKELLSYYQKMEDSRIKYQQMVERFQPAGLTDANLLKPTEHVDQDLTGSLTASNLTLEEEEGIKVVSGASFNFDMSDHVAITGRPGSGKNELGKLLSRQVFPTGGSLNINHNNLSEIPESVIGRQISYVDSEVYIMGGSIKDNLFYVLKNYPREGGEQNIETATERKAASAESVLSGNSTLDIDANWIDFDSLDVDGPAALTEKAIDALRIVGLEDDIFAFGLRLVIDPEANPKLTAGILKARKVIHERLGESEISEMVQVFNKDKYNINASVAENILFGTPCGITFQTDTLSENPYVIEVLDKVGIADTFLEMGLKLAILMEDLFNDLPPGHEFFERFSFIEEDALVDFQKIINLAENKGVEALDVDDCKRLSELPFKLIIAQHRLGLIDDVMQVKLLEARRIFAENLPDVLSGEIEFFDEEKYNAAASILDNVLFGKVRIGKDDTRNQVTKIVTKTINELGLRNTVLEAGLEYDVGIGGKRLTQAQRQKLGIARSLIKNSHQVIVNDATSSFASSQEGVMKAVKQATKDRGLVWITEDDKDVDDYDIVLTMASGGVTERQRGDAARTIDPKPVMIEESSGGLGHEVEILANIPLFAGLDRSKLKLLAFTSERKRLVPGEVLFDQGDSGNAAYVVVEGSFDILISTEEGPVKVTVAKPGDVIGELALLCDAPRTATLKAVNEVGVLKIKKDVFLQLVHDNAEIGANLTKVIARKLEQMMRGYTGGESAPLYDDATGLANKYLFVDRIDSAVNIDIRDKKKSNLILLDFGSILETVMVPETTIEKALIQEIALRLQEVMRKSDSVARLSNASFGIIARAGEGGDDANGLMSRLLDLMKDPVQIGDIHVNLADSVHFDIFPLSEDFAHTSRKEIYQRLNISQS